MKLSIQTITNIFNLNLKKLRLKWDLEFRSPYRLPLTNFTKSNLLLPATCLALFQHKKKFKYIRHNINYIVIRFYKEKQFQESNAVVSNSLLYSIYILYIFLKK